MVKGVNSFHQKFYLKNNTLTKVCKRSNVEKVLWPRWGPSLALVKKWLLWASQHIASRHPLASTKGNIPQWHDKLADIIEEMPAVFGMETNKKAHWWPQLLIISGLGNEWSHLLRSESAHTWCNRGTTSILKVGMKILPQLSWLWRKLKFGGEHNISVSLLLLVLFQCGYDKVLRAIGLRAMLGGVPAPKFGAQSSGLVWDLEQHPMQLWLRLCQRKLLTSWQLGRDQGPSIPFQAHHPPVI